MDAATLINEMREERDAEILSSIFMLNFPAHLERFFEKVASGEVEIYNEFSLQHELGLFLREALSPGYKVQYERPVSFFNLQRKLFEKKEIDIVVYSDDFREKYAIELKYPKNGQYPEQMFKACQDICFLEQLTRAGFTCGYFIIVADDPNFYRSRKPATGIYKYFRTQHPIQGVVEKPTGKRDHRFEIQGNHQIVWNKVAGNTHFAYLSIYTI